MEAITITAKVNKPKHTGIHISADISIFRDPKTMNKEQLTDPDYRLKSLQEEYGGKFDITCSKCHHCR